MTKFFCGIFCDSNTKNKQMDMLLSTVAEVIQNYHLWMKNKQRRRRWQQQEQKKFPFTTRNEMTFFHIRKADAIVQSTFVRLSVLFPFELSICIGFCYYQHEHDHMLRCWPEKSNSIVHVNFSTHLPWLGKEPPLPSGLSHIGITNESDQKIYNSSKRARSKIN